MNFNELASLSLSAVSKASELLEQNNGSFSIESKGSRRDVVTDLEHVIEKFLTHELASSNINVIGEELSSNGKLSDLNWWIDPIDGTSNFVAGLPYYAISVGLASGTDFLLGSVIAPNLKEVYFNYSSQSAFCNGKKLAVSSTPLDSSIIGGSFSKKSNISETEQYKIFGKVNDCSRSVLRTGSATLNVCNVASSKFGAAYGFEAKMWDVAGALAIAKAAGCRIQIRKVSDTTLDYVVANNGCFDQLVQLTGIY